MCIRDRDRVRVNGEGATLNTIVDPERDRVCLNGERLALKDRTVYALLNKPMACTTTMAVGPEHSVAALLPSEWLGLARPVGRLDRETTGGILITDDGDLQVMMTQPDFKLWKTYVATVVGVPTEEQLGQLTVGVDIGENGQELITRPAEVCVLEGSQRQRRVCNKKCNQDSHSCREEQVCDLQIRIHEGRKHQVRRMVRAVKLRMVHLHRSHIGSLALGELPAGSWRALTHEEVEGLYNEAGGSDCPDKWAKENFRKKLKGNDLSAEERTKLERWLGQQDPPEGTAPENRLHQDGIKAE
eukprot:TRINITY_DN20118_c0_g1_i3.p1 TRINITY_DN20118_c0_g1~~TRINITY_DN20118_c0_g1_i3.p1  ORF type:complete len:300 (-),score=77.55 TRINITY_DN20118_c0_g1_i3:275-1174(-)